MRRWFGIFLGVFIIFGMRLIISSFAGSVKSVRKSAANAPFPWSAKSYRTIICEFILSVGIPADAG